MKVITLAKTKELLAITSTVNDAKITSKIPIIDSKVKQICNNRFNYMIIGDTTLDSTYVTVSSVYSSNGDYCNYFYNHGRHGYYGDGINNPNMYDSINDYLEIGQLIEGSGIPEGTYIEEVYYNGDVYNDSSVDFDVPVIKLSANATETGGAVRIYLGINIAYQDVIAKGIQYLLNGTNTTLPTGNITSVGSVSYSNDDSNINHKYGMPGWFVKALPKYVSGH